MRSRVPRRFCGGFGWLLLVFVLFAVEVQAVGQPHRYYPGFPVPDRLLVAEFAGAQETDTSAEEFLLESLAGLAARGVSEGTNDSMIWIPSRSESLKAWLETFRRNSATRVEGPVDTWKLVEHFQKKGIVKGFILFRTEKGRYSGKEAGEAELDISVNVATTLAPILNAVIVDETLEQRALQQGLKLLLDVREKSQEWCFQEYSSHFRRDLLFVGLPTRPHLRSYAIGQGAFFMSGVGPFFHQVLEWLNPDSPVVGWNIGDEYKKTSPVSQWGHFVVPLGLGENLTVLSSLELGKQLPWDSIRGKDKSRVTLLDLDWTEGKHYTSFVMSDGDNARWWMTSLLHSKDFWASPAQERVLLGWGVPVSCLTQLAPEAAQYLSQSTSPNYDLQVFANGYHYPDEMGSLREGVDSLSLHLERLRPMVELWGLNSSVTIQRDWDSENALTAYRKFADKLDRFLGMFVMQYAPYNAGQGKLLWVPQGKGRHMPVLSCRYGLWGNSTRPLNGTPSQVADLINAAPHSGLPVTAEYFDWVVVHAWSSFREKEDSEAPEAENIPKGSRVPPDAKQGIEALEMCVRRLKPHVEVVLPEELLLRLRIHLRPAETLILYLSALNEALSDLRGGDTSSGNGDSYRNAEREVKSAAELVRVISADEVTTQKAAFEQVKRAYLGVEHLRLSSLKVTRNDGRLSFQIPPAIPNPFSYSLEEALRKNLGAADAEGWLRADSVEIETSDTPEFKPDGSRRTLQAVSVQEGELGEGRYRRVRAVSHRGKVRGTWVNLE